jgi:hypothetical protein
MITKLAQIKHNTFMAGNIQGNKMLAGLSQNSHDNFGFVSLFGQVKLNTKVHDRMKTLRYKVFAIGGYIVKKGNQRILKLALAMKIRECFSGLWMNKNNIHSPPSFVF